MAQAHGKHVISRELKQDAKNKKVLQNKNDNILWA
jgi:hypothetical protein